MRIIFLVTNELTYDQRMHRQALSLTRAGFEVTLVGREKPGATVLAAKPYVQHRLPCRFTQGKAFYLEYNVRALRYLLGQQYDIVCAVDLDTIVAAHFAARWQGRRLYYDAHEYFSATPEVVRRPVIRCIWECVGQWLIPRAEKAYTVGHTLAKVLSQAYHRPFAVVRNVPYAYVSPPHVARVQPPVLLYQGALNEGRGLELAISAMGQLPDCQLWLAGEGDLSVALRQLVAAEGLQNRVTFLGYLPPDELKAITPQATLGLNLLDGSSPSYYYSLANKVFDYLQAGVPCVTMDFPEYRQLSEQLGGLICLPDLRQAPYMVQIKTVLRQPAFLDRLQREARAAASQLTWQAEEKHLLAIYSD